MAHLPLPLVSLSLRTQLVDHWRLLREIPLTHWPPPGDTDRNAAYRLVQQRDRRKVRGGAENEIDMSNKMQTEQEREKKAESCCGEDKRARSQVKMSFNLCPFTVSDRTFPL